MPYCSCFLSPPGLIFMRARAMPFLSLYHYCPEWCMALEAGPISHLVKFRKRPLVGQVQLCKHKAPSASTISVWRREDHSLCEEAQVGGKWNCILPPPLPHSWTLYIVHKVSDWMQQPCLSATQEMSVEWMNEWIGEQVTCFFGFLSMLSYDSARKLIPYLLYRYLLGQIFYT